MVDINDKKETERQALAQANIYIPKSLGIYLEENNFSVSKGPVFQTAIIAGTMAVKNTALLVPFCHSITISSININIKLQTQELIYIYCQVKTCAKTGVEMEALTGASIAALTIYDMCKSYSSELVITNIELVEKTGGKRDYKRPSAGGRQQLTDEIPQGSPIS